MKDELEARLQAIEERLGFIEIRLGRAERIAYAAYTDVRSVAKYAYENVLLEATSETVRKPKFTIPGIEQLQDYEALAAGMSTAELITLKMSLRNVTSQCRQDALEVAQLIAALLREAVREQLEEKEAA